MIPMPSGMLPLGSLLAITTAELDRSSADERWLATGVTGMHRGMQGLALQVQEGLKRDPHTGDVFVFRGRRGDLVKILWHDGLGFSLYAKRLERGRFLWPWPADGVVAIAPTRLGYMVEGIDWRHPQQTWRPWLDEAATD
jgi:transposase